MAESAQGRFPRYGDVWIVALDPVVGSEIGKRRPAVVVSNDLNNQYTATVTILPITSAPARRDYPDEIVVPAGVGGLSMHSRIKANMVRTLDKRRLLSLIGSLPLNYHARIDAALKIHLNIAS